MKKALFAAVALIFAGLIFAWASNIFSGKPATTSSSEASPGLPVAGSVPVRTSGNFQAGGMSLVTQNGAMTVNNFLSESSTTADPINSGYYYLGYRPYEGTSNTTATTSPPYLIEYISATNYFNIEILQEPIGATRLAAEAYLAQHLGISQGSLCQLNYMVSVPYWVNQTYAGKNLGFSFCPGATVLP